MLKKTITYTDYDGAERTENFYFNLSKAELMEMELSTPDGGLRKNMEILMEKKNIPGVISVIKDLILKGYGEKSADGRRFIKSKELSDAFMQTGAYSELYMELISDANATAAFLNGMVPPDVRAGVEAQEKERKKENEGPENVSLLSDVTK